MISRCSTVYAVGVDGVIEYTTGTTWFTDSSPAAGQLDGVFVLDAQNAWAVGWGQAVLSYSYPLKVKLVNPNGGEFLPSGIGYTIGWQAPPSAPKSDLQYSLNNGATWSTIVTGLNGVRTYAWTVPALAANTSKVRVRVTSYMSNDKLLGSDTSGPLTIEVVRVLSPNGGEELKAGNTATLRWKINSIIGTVDHVNLFYSTNGGATWKQIPGNIPPSSSNVNWTVPAVTSSNCKLKVVLKNSKNATMATDISDNPFKIGP